MDTRKISLFVYDTEENFRDSKNLIGREGSTLKKILRVSSIEDLDRELNSGAISDDDFVFLVVHVFAFEKIKGYKEFVSVGIREKYPKLGFMLISDAGDKKAITHEMVDGELPIEKVYKYHDVLTNLRNETVTAVRKKDLYGTNDPKESISSHSSQSPLFPKIKYAVITALYKDEFEELCNFFEFPDEKKIQVATKVFYVGHLKGHKEIEIVAAVPNATGMLDSSIVATLMLEYFRPDYIFMSGVCGGGPGLKFGDIIIAKQVFTFQKGKLSDLKDKNVKGELTKIELFDAERKPIDYNHLYDLEGNQVVLSIEKFERELDSVINLNSAVEDLLNPKIAGIKEKINKDIRRVTSYFELQPEINIEVAPMACSTMVINKEGFFEDTIRSVERKTAAVEMESYGVARACQFANQGKTIAIIFKSVMDNTSNKSDSVRGINVKKFAAFTSAHFLKYLLEDRIL